MISVKDQFPLTELNTFHINAFAKYYIELNDSESVAEFLKSGSSKNMPHFVMGGGSNVLFTKDYDGMIIRPLIKGIEKLDEDKNSVRIRAGAGEIWDDLVAYCVQNHWVGLENLSWIPGHVGACPVQNIGAYGLEVKDYIEHVEGYFFDSGKYFKLTSKECVFAYRNSIFKNELKNNVILTHVTFLLGKESSFHLNYPDLKKEMSAIPDPTLIDIREAIINIRKIKLPDPNETGNAGSFFKNPILPKEKVLQMQQEFPEMPVYSCSQNHLKLSAAWLIDQSGCKGKTLGKAGTHPRQPLIIINLGGAEGWEILKCAQFIQNAVFDKFRVQLEMEVNVL
jgi:UDP-N-acetylmuramate dehydrogenase